MRSSILTATILSLSVGLARSDPAPPPQVGGPATLSVPKALEPSRSDALAPARFDDVLFERALRRAKWRRNVGIGLSIPGVTLLVLGGVVIGFGGRDPNYYSGGIEIASGAISAAVGAAFLIPGVPLWLTGQDDMDLANWRLRQLSPTSTAR
jgi:hypothetical protein